MRIDMDAYAQMSDDVRKALNTWMLENDLGPLVFEFEWTPEQITCRQYRQTPLGKIVLRGGEPVVDTVKLPTVSPLPAQVQEYAA